MYVSAMINTTKITNKNKIVTNTKRLVNNGNKIIMLIRTKEIIMDYLLFIIGYGATRCNSA